MEEDIKTIENIIDTLKFHIEYENYEENILDECKRDIKAIENLLKRYKELEEELESEKFYHKADKEFIQKYHDEASELNTKCINLEAQLSNSIPISVIQNRLDELDEQIKEFSTYVDESTGEEKQYWKRERAELVGARGALLGLLKVGKE